MGQGELETVNDKLKNPADGNAGPVANGSTSLAQEPQGLASLRLVSLNHRTAPLEVLDRVALAPDAVRRLLRALRSERIEALALSTCNRVELYFLAGSPEDERAARRALEHAWSEPLEAARECALHLEGVAAARHLFRVAAGLESLLVGESEILGQLRGAVEVAEAEGSAGPALLELGRTALRLGGRARASTRIGAGALSVASAAVQSLRHARPDLERLEVVVLGAGHTGLKAAQHLRAEGVRRLAVLNRTLARAREVAARLEAEAGGLEDLPFRLARADALLVAVHAPAPIVTAEAVREAMAESERPLVIVDLSLPRAVEPAVETLPGVSLIDLSRLETVVAESRERREGEIPRVEAMLERELAALEERFAEEAARPLVAELRQRAEAIRRAEVERAVAAGLAEASALEHVTRRLVDRLLRAPSTALRQAPRRRAVRTAPCLECVFGLPQKRDHGAA